MSTLDTVAPQFVTMAHRIVWAIVGTTRPDGEPSTRVLHPVWDWDGTSLTGWIATSPQSPKATHLAKTPKVSITYWAPNHDTCTADCVTTWDTSDDARIAGWNRFRDAPPPVGYDPKIVPGWDSPSSLSFGVLRLAPRRLRVMPGSLMTEGKGELLAWRAAR